MIEPTESAADRLESAEWMLCREMERLGCEVTSVRRAPGIAGRWCVEWRPIDTHGRPVSFGAMGDSAVAALSAALANAKSDLGGVELTEQQPERLRSWTRPRSRSRSLRVRTLATNEEACNEFHWI